MCGAWACIKDRGPDPDVPGGNGGNGDTGGEDKYMLLLRISPLDAGAATAADVTERIKSLRIIVLSAPEDEGGTEGGADDTGGTGGSGGANDATAAVPEIEYNRLITPEEFGTTTAAGFQYEIMLLTTKGKKDIYLIANEESVSNIQYQQADGSTQNPNKSLTKFLEEYKKTTDNKTPDAAEFKKAIEAIYFEPTYEPDTENKLYLPYTSHYEVVTADKGENGEKEVTELTMYLVPVATKFTFKFVNKLDKDVYVNEISVKSTNTHNFLLAHVGKDDYEKDFDGDKMYWVDWLAKVAERTHNAPDNAGINDQYGWISDYEIPTASTLAETTFISIKDKVTIPAKTTETKDDGSTTETPGVKVLGPYYRPESRREITYPKPGTDENGEKFEETITEHQYLLTLDLKDNNNVGPEFNDVVIKYLHALFRDTSVYITITISGDDVEVYAEIAGWNRHDANGWVNKGDDGMYVDPDKQIGAN